jgi:putative transposase
MPRSAWQELVVRSLRVDLIRIAQHVIRAGNDRRPCFFVEIDYTRYLQDLRETARREGCAVHAYVLMMTSDAAGCVGRSIKALRRRRYVRYMK